MTRSGEDVGDCSVLHGPSSAGSARLAEWRPISSCTVIQGVQKGLGPGYAQKVDKLAAFARGKGFCSLVEMAAAPVQSALRVFAEDFASAAGPARTDD